MATYLNFASSNPDLFNAHLQLVNGIAMNGTVSFLHYIKPYFIRVPHDGTFNQIDIGFAISTGFTSTFRLGNNPTAGTALPTGHIWHNLSSVDHFFIPLEICAIQPPPQMYVNLDITVITYDQGIITPISQTFTFNLL